MLIGPKTRQFIPNRAESGNWVQKVDIKFIDKRLQYKLQVDKRQSHSPQSHTWGAIKNAKKSSLFIM